MRAIACGLMMVMSAPLGVLAEEKDKRGDFTCTPVPAFGDANANTETIRINNFSLREGSNFLAGGTSELEITYAVANRAQAPTHVSADFIIFDAQNLPLAAMNAQPMFKMVQPGKTESASGSTFVMPGTLEKAATVCLRLSVFNQ